MKKLLLILISISSFGFASDLASDSNNVPSNLCKAACAYTPFQIKSKVQKLGYTLQATKYNPIKFDANSCLWLVEVAKNKKSYVVYYDAQQNDVVNQRKGNLVQLAPTKITSIDSVCPDSKVNSQFDE